MARRDLRIHDNSKWEPDTLAGASAIGAGFHEAPRGALGHWVHIKDGTIANYQCVVPSTWNAGPRDAAGKRGPYEEALVGTPVPTRRSRSRSCAPSTPSIPAWPAASTSSTRSGASSRG